MLLISKAKYTQRNYRNNTKPIHTGSRQGKGHAHGDSRPVKAVGKEKEQLWSNTMKSVVAWPRVVTQQSCWFVCAGNGCLAFAAHQHDVIN